MQNAHNGRPIEGGPAATYSVGQVYPNWDRIRRKVCHDGAHYNFDTGGHRLLIFGRNLRADEVLGFFYGPAYFAMAVHGSVLFLTARFGTALPLVDAPYSIHMVPAERRVLPPVNPAPAGRTLLQTDLIDSSTGVLRGIRLTSWSPHFTRAVHAAIHSQAAAPITREAYNDTIAAAYRRWPAPEDIMADALALTLAGE